MLPMLSTHYPSGIEVSSDPLIYVFDNFLTAEECDHIIACARNNMTRAEVTFDKTNAKSTQRTNNVNWIPHQQTPITNNISIRACQTVGMPLVNAEFIQVIHYAETQEYQPHFDAWDAATDVGKRCMETGGQRLITCLIYLNDVEEGGGTIFPNLDVEVRAVKGRMVLFHNCQSGTNIIHPDSLHGGMPVVKGEKWACNLWFRERQFQNVVAGAVKAGSTNYESANGNNSNHDNSNLNTFGQNLRNDISADWLRWVAENRLRNCTPASMVETMVAAGVDRAVATHAAQTIDNDPVFQAFAPFLSLKRKENSMASNLQKLRDSMPGQLQVERRAKLSRDEFIDRYVLPARPVVITDLIDDWPARTRWTPQYLKERFGNVDVEIQAERNKDKRFEQNKLNLRKKMRLADFADLVTQGGATNDYYLTANNEALRNSKLSGLLKDVGTLPAYCDASTFANNCSIWFGPAGTNTPLHHDTLMLFHSQMMGRKRWRLISPLQTHRLYNYMTYFSEIDLDNPDLVRHPDFADVNVLDVVVEPGETIFLPLSWWHQVTSLDTCISFSFNNLNVPNHFEYVNPEIPHWCA